MQNRLVRKRDLEIALSKIKPHPSPNAYLEQYTITPRVAAELLYVAAYVYDDIIGKTVADLGCGTGRLAIGSAFLGANMTVGVDIDKLATQIASNNAEKLKVRESTQWVTSDITAIRGTVDTVLQNPPFGVQKRNADRQFLEKALEIGKHLYSLHKSSRETYMFFKKLKKITFQFAPVAPSPFLKKFIEQRGGKIRGVYATPMMIPHMFNFHRKRKHQFLVDLYMVET